MAGKPHCLPVKLFGVLGTVETRGSGKYSLPRWSSLRMGREMEKVRGTQRAKEFRKQDASL